MAQWNKKLLTCRRWEVRTRVRQLFCRKSSQSGEKNFSTLKPRNSPLKPSNSTHSTLKDAGALRWNFFHRYSPLILQYFLTKPRPGCYGYWLIVKQGKLWIKAKRGLLIITSKIYKLCEYSYKMPLQLKGLRKSQLNEICWGGPFLKKIDIKLAAKIFGRSYGHLTRKS